MAIPAYSIFSATSELLVTAAVFYVVWRAWRFNDFRRGLLVAVLIFEAAVNISYMAIRMLAPSSSLHDSPDWLVTTAALHGILSLAMFLFLIFITIMAWRDNERGYNFFRESPTTTWAFVGLWTISIISGEFLFAMLYLA
ncbi:MAG: hypothetical protein ACYC2H_00265 [Thermoplasmatota archaeon]